jgi:hypothetical protein
LVFKEFKEFNDDYKLAAIAFNAAFLFFGVADLTNFKAADLTRLALDDVLFFAVLRFVVVRFFAVVLRFAVVFLLLKSPIFL